MSLSRCVVLFGVVLQDCSYHDMLLMWWEREEGRASDISTSLTTVKVHTLTIPPLVCSSRVRSFVRKGALCQGIEGW
ncbi:MAG: hypothetical protein J3Q66DRAFT_332085 [Benniella sp.]|nr:MAG: hypothetical protein J3Q66DRAFT_332085 [Benniella sp.]